MFDPHNHLGGIVPYRVLSLLAGATGPDDRGGADLLAELLDRPDVGAGLRAELGWTPAPVDVEDFLAHHEVTHPDGTVLKVVDRASALAKDTVWSVPAAYAPGARRRVVVGATLARVEAILLGRFFEVVRSVLAAAERTGSWAGRSARLAAGSGVLPQALRVMEGLRAPDWRGGLADPGSVSLDDVKPLRHLLQHVLSAGPVTDYDTAYVVRGFLLNAALLAPGSAPLTLDGLYAGAVRELVRQGVTYAEVSAGADDITALHRSGAVAATAEAVTIGWLGQVTNSLVTNTPPDRFPAAVAALADALRSGRVVGFSLLAPETTDYATPHFRANLTHLLQLCTSGPRRVAHIHVGEGAPVWQLDAAGVDSVLVGKRSATAPQLAEGALRHEAQIARRNIDTVLDVLTGAPRRAEVRIRLGHVTHVTPAQAARIRELEVWADVNLTSNVATGAWMDREPRRSDLKRLTAETLLAHGVHSLAAARVPFVLGTDGGGVEHSTLLVEHELLAAVAAAAGRPAWVADVADAAREHTAWMAAETGLPPGARAAALPPAAAPFS